MTQQEPLPGAELVAVAMSGGVDSSVAALLIKQAGYNAVGITMKLWTPPCDEESGIDEDKTCCTVDSAMDAKRVCDQIGIPHYTLDMQEDFEERVIQPFYEAYLEGHTPNPCVNCNSFVKWDALWKSARSIGAAKLATGHYAATHELDGRSYILRGDDPGKDQSYFLWGIPPATLRNTLFPLGRLNKREVREMAETAGLRTAQKSESQDICFIPNGNYRTFIEARARKEERMIPEGVIRGPGGEELGRHRGLTYYTVGQRKGIGVAASEPLYVKSLEMETNTLVLGRKEDLYSDGFTAEAANFFCEPFETRECLVQIRYRAPVKPAEVRNEGNGRLTVRMHEPGFCVSPGQSAVFFEGDRLIGGARIVKPLFRPA